MRTVAHSVLLLFLAITVAVVAVPAIADATEGFPLYSWGSNPSGQLGQGDTSQRNVPTRVPGPENWVQVAQGAEGSFGINTYGHLYGWGSHWNNNQMGQGSNPANPGTGNITSPTRIGTESNWTQVSARNQHVVAINSNGELFSWGGGAFDNNNGPIQRPLTQFATWRDATSMQNRIFAITVDGHLYSWGQSGLSSAQWGRPGSSGTPLRVGGNTTWARISTGGDVVLGLTTDGYLYSWGANTIGQLGREDTPASPNNLPGRVGTTNNWRFAAVTTNNAAAAITTDGRLYTWGSTENGQLARPDTPSTPAHLPGLVEGRTNWVFLASANAHFLAFTADYRLYAWGNNGSGRLGIGEAGGFRDEPTLVFPAYGFSAAARGGGTRSLMLMRTTPPIQEELKLTKHLEMPVGTPIPDLTFTFTFERNSFNGNPADSGYLPVIPDREIQLNSSSTTTSEDGVITLIDMVDALEDINFNRTGVFSWIVREEAGTSGAVAPSSVNYSEAEFELRVYVRHEGGVGGDFYIDAVTVHRIQTDDGTLEDPPEKTNDFIFTNIYTRTTTGDGGALVIAKDVVGRYANLATVFNFDVIVTRTTFCELNATFAARIYNADGSLNRNETFETGVLRTIPLTHGQRIVFPELIVGTGFNVTEQESLDFTASVNLIIGGTPVTVAANTSPNLSLPLGPRLVGDGANSATFINTHNHVPPTGLIMDNLPAVIFAAVVLALVVLLMVSKRQRGAIRT